ncbi:ubiquinol oxidase subunit II [Marinomonas sp. C2222]|uniref:Ubiquinol oxidase subunit 2 n=1 Tax=Marinomonas sargassi TaxID=2984494 RepID=A0ABT2YTS2_9GAMM|nr:ubiquinol oxidase subunit II [Marinomonas sargassi]MCV2403292.1 ubiquinol oxidase subunit II [Marinomonas sargassi]
MKKKLFQSTMVFSLALLLSGCELALFDSSGVTGKEIGDTILLTMGLMLIVVIPTIIMSIWIPYKYHESKKDEVYDPEWEHSSKIEFFAWGVPVVIIAVLAVITYITSYSLDPRKEIASDKEPLTIQVVAMDWKWLFLYPEEKIATVNEVAFPVDRPVEFLVTSQSTMNSLFIPKLGGQIYAMAGMENRMNLMATEVGEYRGISANYSGFGFAGMRFKAKVTSEEDYGKWIEGVRTSEQVLTDAEYDRLTEKTRDHKVEHFSSIDPLQFKNIIESFIGAQNGSN